MARPVLYVLAGVNGAGKSSIGGHLLEQAGLTWFNPDAFARELLAATGCSQDEANVQAWAESVRRLDEAITEKRNHAFETTLGGRTVADRILAAARTHDVMVWFCGLASPDLHVRRVRARVASGGHDIPEARIRERYPRAIANLIRLMPHLAHLQVYDNSVEAALDETVPDPILVLEVRAGRLMSPSPRDAGALGATPDWAKALVEAAVSGWRPPPSRRA
jgi:predicted ABC-type ATPase